MNDRMKPLRGPGPSGRTTGSGPWPPQKHWEPDSGLGYIGTSQVQPVKSSQAPVDPPSPCLKQRGLGVSLPQPGGVPGQVCGCSPPLSLSPGNHRCPFQGRSPPAIQTAPLERGSEDAGRERRGEGPDCLLGPGCGAGRPSRDWAEPRASALINGPQPAGGGPGRRIRGGEGQLPPIGRAPAFLPRCGSNATFRMQRRARPVCSGSRGPGAGNQLASVSEIRARGGGGGRWANTRRPPQSPVLDSARGSAGRAVTRRRAAGWRGGRGGGARAPSPAGGGTSAPAPGEAWPLRGDRHRAREQSIFFFLPMLRILHPFLNERTVEDQLP